MFSARSIVAMALVLLALAATAGAQPLKPGDLVAARALPTIVPGVTPTRLTWFSNGAGRTAFEGACAFAAISADAEVWASIVYPRALRVFDADANVLREYPPLDWCPNVAAISDGNIVLNGGQIIAVLDQQGNVLRQYSEESVGGRIDTDVAPDNCTLLFLSVGFKKILRFNICTGESLPAWTSVSSPLSVRALADGGAVVGTYDGLAFLDANGTIVATRQLGVSGYSSAIAFDADPRYLWVGLNQNPTLELVKVDLRSGLVVQQIPRDGNWGTYDLAVYGETRPTLAEVLPSEVPTLSPWLLLALGAVLAGVALRAAV